MENFENTPQTTSPLIINNEIREFLNETSKWGKFLAIMGYIGVGFLALAGVVMMIGFSALGEFADADFPVGVFGLFYIAAAVLYYFPTTFLFNFSKNIKEGLDKNDQEGFNSAFENLKALYKFKGILTIVIVSLYVLILLFAIPFGIIASLS